MKLMTAVLCGVSLLLPMLVEANINSILGSHPTPQQMHLVGAQPSASSSNNNSSGASQMAKVQAIMAKDKELQTTSQIHASATTLQSRPDSDAHMALSNEQQQKMMALSRRLSVLGQQMLMLQQRTDSKINELANHLQTSQQNALKLRNAMRLMNTEVIALSHPGHSNFFSSNSTGSSHSKGSSLIAVIEAHYLIYGFGTVVLILLIVYLFLMKSNKEFSMAGKKVDNQEEQQEYDFLGSQEGIAAKINLARSYLAMEEYEQMRQVLTEVIKKGDDDQRKQAHELLDKIVK